MSFDARRRQPFFLSTLTLTLVAGCASAPEIPKTGNGELHQGTFVYSCSGAADVGCGATSLPDGIAVGADFDLRFDPAPPLPTTLEPSAAFFSVDATGTFHALRAGYGVVLVKDSSGAVVDFVNLRVKTIALIDITGIDATTALALGESRTVTAAAFDSAAVRLAGSLPLEWESADDAIATVNVTDQDRANGTATIHAVAAGTTRIRVVTGASTGSLTIKVGS